MYDILATTSNPEIIKGVYKDELPVTYNAPKPEKIMFTDYTKIIIKAGDGGNGATSFRREKYVAAGRT